MVRGGAGEGAATKHLLHGEHHHWYTTLGRLRWRLDGLLVKAGAGGFSSFPKVSTAPAGAKASSGLFRPARYYLSRPSGNDPITLLAARSDRTASDGCITQSGRGRGVAPIRRGRR